jgi:hypothetical protein
MPDTSRAISSLCRNPNRCWLRAGQSGKIAYKKIKQPAAPYVAGPDDKKNKNAQDLNANSLRLVIADQE